MPLYFRYLTKLYILNLSAVLFGLTFAFAAIDYFSHIQKLTVSSNYKILYVFYMWQESLGLLYPLSIVFAVIMTKLSLVKNNTMGAFHAFGYDKKRVFLPLFLVAFAVYLIFISLHTTEFSYARDKAKVILSNQIGKYNVNDVFFKYNDSFVYIKSLDPIKKRIKEITIFKIKGHKVEHTINAPLALFEDKKWHAKNATIKRHIYKDAELIKYEVEHLDSIETLDGYRPKIIESLHEGKVLNIIDAYHTWRLLESQNLNSDKVRAVIYNKILSPLFSLALMIILFFKLPFHGRMMNMGIVVALSLGGTFVVWGILFGLDRIGSNGVILPEFGTIVPIVLLWIYAIYVYIKDV